MVISQQKINYNSAPYDNDSYTFFGPIDMAFYNDRNTIHFSDTVKAVVSLLIGASMLVSIIGNFCTCLVIARDRSMRTPTNAYLFNLAISDLLLAFFAPSEIYNTWIPDFYPFGEEGCRLHFLLLDLLCNCSVLTIFALTVERYLVLSKPFLRQNLSSFSRVYKVLGVIWATSIVFSVPDVFYTDLLDMKTYVYCYFILPDGIRILLAIDIIVFFIVPMTMIVSLFLLIALTIKSKKTSFKLRSNPEIGSQNKDKAIRMLAAVAASFFFCWTPYCVLRIMLLFPQLKYEGYYKTWRVLNYFCSVNYYLSTAVNPVLYSLMSRKFRNAFKDLLRSGNRNRTRRAATASLTSTVNDSVRISHRMTSVGV